MKILYLVHQFYPEYWTGTEKVVLKMSSMMQKAGQDVGVITYSFCEDTQFDKNIGDMLYREFSYRGIRVTALRHRHIPDDIHVALGDTGMRTIAERLLSAAKPDIIHVGHPMRVGEILLAAKSSNLPYVITLTDFWLLCPKFILVDSKGDLCPGPHNGDVCRRSCPELPSDLIKKRLVAAGDILLGARTIVAPSAFVAAMFRNEFGDLNIKVVNHGVSYSTIKRNNRTSGNGSTLIFCYAGSLNHHKGAHVLVEAFKGIHSENVVLRMFGSGPDPLYVNRVFDVARNDKRIEFWGVFPEEKVGEILSTVDVVIVPSLWYESYCLVLAEALACHTPVIVPNVGAMAERVRDRVNGFTFSLGNSDSLRATMEEVIANPSILDDLKRNSDAFFVPTVEQEAYAYYKMYACL